MRVQMLGLCRFSYLGGRGFQIDHDSIDQRRDFLYDPARLKRRWYWFRHIALPAWLAQSDPDFTLVIMTGPDLPAPYLARLRRLVGKLPQLRLELVPPMEFHLPACRAAIAPHVDPMADVIGHFRHDDDDAVAFDYIARARADFMTVTDLWRRTGALCIDHSRGLMADVTKADGPRITPRICHNMGVAMTIFLPPSAEKTALHFEHWKVAEWMPNLSLTDAPMFLRLIHGDANSGAMGAGFPWSLNPGDMAPMLKDRFGVEMGDLDRGARRFSVG